MVRKNLHTLARVEEEEPRSRKGPFSSWIVGEEGKTRCCKKQPCSQKFLKFPMKVNHLNQFKC